MENVNQMFFCTDGTLQYYRDSAIGIHTKASSQRTNIVRKKDKVNISLGLGDMLWVSSKAIAIGFRSPQCGWCAALGARVNKVG